MTRSLLSKLGWKPGVAAMVWRLPDSLGASLGALTEVSDAPPTFRIGFVHDRAELDKAAHEIAAPYVAGGHLWLCYPKQSGSIPTDLTRDRGWEPILALSLLPVSQVAIDDDWSALRFRLRSEITRLTRRGEAG